MPAPPLRWRVILVEDDMLDEPAEAASTPEGFPTLASPPRDLVLASIWISSSGHCSGTVTGTNTSGRADSLCTSSSLLPTPFADGEPRFKVFWISSKCFTSSHNYENFANVKRTIWKHVVKHGQEKRPFLKDLIPCLHFSENFKNLEKLGGGQIETLAWNPEYTGKCWHVSPEDARSQSSWGCKYWGLKTWGRGLRIPGFKFKAKHLQLKGSWSGTCSEENKVQCSGCKLWYRGVVV